MATKKRTKAPATSKKKLVKKAVVSAARKSGQIKKKTITQKPERRSLREMLGMQFIIAGSAVAVLIFLGVIQQTVFSTLRSKAAEPIPVTVSIEHNSPVRVGVVFARKEHAGYVALQNNSDEKIHVSVPSTWHRTEVMGAKISDVVSEIPVFGFTRWTLPGHSGMRMLLPEAPAAVFFESQSQTTASIEMQMIDLTTLSSTNHVVLIQKQGSLVPLWTDEE